MARKPRKTAKDSLNVKTKRCWSCNTHMKLGETHCPFCKRKVGKINEHGVAVKPTEWLNYFLAIAGTVVLVYFIWWAFVRG
jgi:hypothetical protein